MHCHASIVETAFTTFSLFYEYLLHYCECVIVGRGGCGCGCVCQGVGQWVCGIVGGGVSVDLLLVSKDMDGLIASCILTRSLDDLNNRIFFCFIRSSFLEFYMG